VHHEPRPHQIPSGPSRSKIEELIALLDHLDGDENLWPYLADTDPENADWEEDDEREQGTYDEPSLGLSNPCGLRVQV